jgi:hypothetical protein
MTTEYDPNCDCSECARAERDHLRAQMQPLPAGRILGMMTDELRASVLAACKSEGLLDGPFM